MICELEAHPQQSSNSKRKDSESSDVEMDDVSTLSPRSAKRRDDTDSEDYDAIFDTIANEKIED